MILRSRIQFPTGRQVRASNPTGPEDKLGTDMLASSGNSADLAKNGKFSCSAQFLPADHRMPKWVRGLSLLFLRDLKFLSFGARCAVLVPFGVLVAGDSSKISFLRLGFDVLRDMVAKPDGLLPWHISSLLPILFNRPHGEAIAMNKS